jgi:TolB protein
LPGGRIAFSSDRDGGNEFYVMNADGSGQRNLSHGWPSTYGGPWVAWSPSGERVAYVFGATWPGAKSSLYVMNTDGSGRQKLVDGVQYDAPPSWSTDGHRIAFERHLGGWERGSREIFTVNADGSGLQRLTRRPGQDDYPVWSPPQTR